LTTFIHNSSPQIRGRYVDRLGNLPLPERIEIHPPTTTDDRVTFYDPRLLLLDALFAEAIRTAEKPTVY
jgi:hypothetical protein